MAKLIAVLCFSFILIITFCHKNQSSRIIDEELFVKIYCDVAIHHEASLPGTQKTFIDSLFLQYQVTEGNFRATVEHYKRHPERWERGFKKIVAELEVREKLGEKLKDSLP
ncbi:MAG: DUF4296 domain-containing protein [candidate division KSB1 bacterium]|nr:DUF4296 domain-containing protein [candidate division KSB1 bacterium]